MLWRGLKFLTGAIVDFALPPRCPVCGVVQDEVHAFCPPCWGDLHWLSGGCGRCGLPLAVGDVDECARCQASPPPFERIRSAVAYGDVPKMLVTKLKYGRKVGLADTLARVMAPLAAGEEEPILVPVPLHRRRLWWRGFNQSLLIARALEKAGKGRVAPDLLRRIRPTKALKGMNAGQRQRETKGAFRASDAAASLKGRRIILVDDVLTTGSTADACARALRKAGVRRIELLTFARVVAHDGGAGTGEMA